MTTVKNKATNAIPLSKGQSALLKYQFLAIQENYERKIRELSIIKELGMALRSGILLDPEDFWSSQLEIVRKYRPLNSISFLLEDEETHRFKHTAWIKNSESGHLPPPGLLPVHQEVLGRRDSICMAEVDKGTELAKYGRSCLFMPIIHNNTVIGILSFFSSIKDDFDQNQIRFFHLVADHFATAAILSRLYRQMVKEEKQRFFLSRFFSKTVSQQIMESKGILRLGGERKKVAILFSDLRGFTAMSEELEPEAVVEILNHYFSGMIPIIFQHDGTLDKVMGDGLLAIFGAPIPHPDDTIQAVTAAIKMVHALNEFNDRFEDEIQKRLSVSMGINTGDVVAGYIGSEDHLNYTVIGDTVNVAQRFQTLAGENEIFISRSVFDEISTCRDRIQGLKGIVALPAQKVKGKESALEVFRLEL